MNLGLFLLIVLLFAMIGAAPAWPHSREWGYWPSGVLALSVAALAFVLLADGLL
jgi:hypothetical protein